MDGTPSTSTTPFLNALSLLCRDKENDDIEGAKVHYAETRIFHDLNFEGTEAAKEKPWPSRTLKEHKQPRGNRRKIAQVAL